MTVSLDEETARWARIEAARQDTSLSRFVGMVLRERMAGFGDYEQARGSFLSRTPTPLRDADQAIPTRDEVHRR